MKRSQLQVELQLASRQKTKTIFFIKSNKYNNIEIIIETQLQVQLQLAYYTRENPNKNKNNNNKQT